MYATVVLLAGVILLTHCKPKASSEAASHAQEISETIKANSPGGELSSAAGSYLQATIDGKDWTATDVKTDHNPSSSYKLVHGEAGETIISFQLWKPTTGMKRSFGEDFAAEFWTDDGIFGGRKGELTITKADDQWVEGTFYFTATSMNTEGKHEVTNGKFKVSAK